MKFRPFFLIAALLALSLHGARAGDLLRGGASAPRSGAAAQANALGSAAADAAARNQRDALARTTRAVQDVRRMQDAARAAAVQNKNGLQYTGIQLPNVPNGLTPGGLQVAPGVPADLAQPGAGENSSLWQGAALPAQTQTGEKTTVTIVQKQSQALLNWKTFNIGKDTTVNFDQSAGGSDAGKWIAFNKVSDPTGVPSQILGAINAPGQVYIINANGILFGGSSQINLNALVASSLPINDNLIQRGLLNNPDSQFLFSGLDLPAGGDGTPAFKPGQPTTSDGRFGDVIVKPGALIQTRVPLAGSGGRVMLIGANVENAGQISTPSGQTILAAGLQIGVAAHATDDPSLRGLDVFVGAVGDYAGAATNSGLIESRTGSVSMAGRWVRQSGAVTSVTSVDLNGRIDLIGGYNAVPNPDFEVFRLPQFVRGTTGTVILGENSVTEIRPDFASVRTVPGRSLPEPSQINIEGLAVQLRRGAEVLAPNADISVRAGIYPSVNLPLTGPDRTTFFPNGVQQFLFSGGQIYLDPQATINAAGSTDVTVPLSQSILDVTFRGPELSDSPLQRDGFARGSVLSVDLRRTGVMNGRFFIGTPLGDVTGLANLIERNAAQLTAAGGNVSLRAGGSIVIGKGATVDVSGGYFRHEAGMVRTSRLLQGGRLVDIADADPSQRFDGVFTGTNTILHPKYGISETFRIPLVGGEHFEPSTIEGAAGGTLTLTAPSQALDGELIGLTVRGPRQRETPAPTSSLSLSIEAQRLFQAPNLPSPIFLTFSPTPPEIVFARESGLAAAEAFALENDLPRALRPDRVAQIVLSPDLLGPEAFGRLSVSNVDGNIVVPKGIALNAPAFGSIQFSAANVTILGEVSARSGLLDFSAFAVSPSVATAFTVTPVADPFLPPLPPAPDPSRGNFVLGGGATLDASGLLTDERNDGLSQMRAAAGGRISVASYDADLRRGGVIDVSGGATVSGTGRVSYGNGGSLSILAGRDPGFSRAIGGSLVLDSRLNGISGLRGAALTLQASAVQIGGRSQFPNTLLLAPDFFRQGGFASYDITGIGVPPGIDNPEAFTPAIFIAPGTRIEPVAGRSLARLFASRSGGAVLDRFLPDEGQRTPVSLRFAALGFDEPSTIGLLDARGDIVMGARSVIATDAGGSVTFAGQTVSLLGAVSAPGGTISVSGANRFPVGSNPNGVTQVAARTTVFLGPDVRLSTAGKAVFAPDAFGRRLGQLYGGGSVLVRGNIVADAGAVLDASGASAEFDFTPAQLGIQLSPLEAIVAGLGGLPVRLRSVAARQDSAGGSITLAGGEFLFSDAVLLGSAGGPAATGGLLAVSSGLFFPDGQTPRNSALVNLTVVQQGMSLPGGTKGLGIGSSIQGLGGVARDGGFFAVEQFSSAGFDSLDLGYDFRQDSVLGQVGGNVQFQGPVSIAARGSLRVASGGAVYATGPVRLKSSYAVLGQPFRPPVNPNESVPPPFVQGPLPAGAFAFGPTSGPGSLSVSARLIDIGTVSLQNIGQADFTAAGGDIRGNGYLNIEGDLRLTGAQIYPTAQADFGIFAFDPAGRKGSVTIAQSGTQATPVSVGGSLRIYASNIFQGGTLRAPLGTIALGYDGTDLDPSDADIDQPPNPVALVPGTASRATPVTGQLSLLAGSLTSTQLGTLGGAGGPVPFGLSPDGTSWIDPRGENVTLAGLPSKQIVLRGEAIATAPGSTLDIQGGSDLFAYRFISGNLGTVDFLGTASGAWSAGTVYGAGDLVAFGGQTFAARVQNSGQTPSVSAFWTLVAESYAILPGYDPSFAPYLPFNANPAVAQRLGGDPGYVSNLAVGAQIRLERNADLPAGNYTLLPRRYAVLPGAFLVTPTTAQPAGLTGAVVRADGLTLAAGQLFNALDRAETLGPVRTQFQILSPDDLLLRVQYDRFLGNSFLAQAAAAAEIARPQRLPVDAGYLAFQAVSTFALQGNALTGRSGGGRGAAIDLSSLADLRIVGPNADPNPPGVNSVDGRIVSGWGAESLVIGGLRRSTPTGTTIDVRTVNLTLDNAGAVLTNPEITLIARQRLAVTGGSALASSGSLSEAAENFLIGPDAPVLRVSGDPLAAVTRTGAPTASAQPLLSLGAEARLAGTSVIVDSSFGTLLDPTVLIEAGNLMLGSGQISIVQDGYAGALSGGVVPTQLVLSGALLRSVQESAALTLRSARTIDIYGTGVFGSDSLRSLSLLAGGLRGYGAGGAGEVILAARDIRLAAPASAIALPIASPTAGTLRFQSETFRLGDNSFAVSGFPDVIIGATGGFRAEGNGAFTTPGNLTVETPSITGGGGSIYAVTAGGALRLTSVSTASTLAPQTGATLRFTGTEILADTAILLPSGVLNLTATIGDLVVNDRIDVSGVARNFFDEIRFADAGNVTLTASAGNVTLTDTSRISVASAAEGGNAGVLAINAANGLFTAGGTLVGGAENGRAGTFRLDVGSIGSIDAISQKLEAGQFSEERNLRIRNGDVVVGGVVNTRNFLLSTDRGSIGVTGTIDASGVTGGSITLAARDSVTVSAGAKLTVAAEEFSSAGKGGVITLEAGAQSNGLVNLAGAVNLQTGATLDLSVADLVAGDYTTVGSSAFSGQFTGKLHLRAPRVGNDVGVGPIGSTITGASSVVVEGYRLYNAATLDNALRAAINADATAYIGAGFATMRAKLLSANPDAAGLASVLVLSPGVEIVNRNGDLTLGTPTSTATSDWDLSRFRYGPDNAPGILTLRARGDLVFFNALSDGFTPTGNTGTSLWLAPIDTIRSTLPVNTQSWSYRLTAGSDFGAADFRRILSPAELAVGKGSLLLGKFYSSTGVSGNNATTETAINNRYQVIRTGTGNIEIATARDVQLRNYFATIYTAGIAVPSPTTVFTTGDFSRPVVEVSNFTSPPQGPLGAVQQIYSPAWSMAGGDLTISARENIRRVTGSAANPVTDTSYQLPSNWLYRRGYVDPATGRFGPGLVTVSDFDPFTGISTPRSDTSASTAWWVDFSNFFEGVGALGGGDVTLTAGNDIVNVDAAIPTNARMAGIDPVTGQNLAPDPANLLQLGGGDLIVQTGRNIDGGIYYVERGEGRLTAGGSIVTNALRSTSATASSAPETWLPTTVFVGDARFDVTARGNVLIGPASNAFILPQGLNNKFYYKTYFNTFSPEAALKVASFGGSVTHRLATVSVGSASPRAILNVYADRINTIGSATASTRPWIRLAETNVAFLEPFLRVNAPTLSSTSFGGDVNIAGALTLQPSSTGGLSLLASGGIIGLQNVGQVSGSRVFSSSVINVSDADPRRVPSPVLPVSYQEFVGPAFTSLRTSPTQISPLQNTNLLFAETGSFLGANSSVQVQQALHSPGPLHAGDPTPVRLYAGGGDITALTLFSPKATRIFAGNDITDISFYLQNVGGSDVSIVSAGRDIVPFNENTSRRAFASDLVLGNRLGDLPRLTSVAGVTTVARAGDIQINGPGFLEVLAGRNLDLGTGPNLADGTGAGITSIGNFRNPFLPATGAGIIVLAGVTGPEGTGPALGLSRSSLDFDAFAGLATGAATMPAPAGDSEEEQAIINLAAFFDILRQSGQASVSQVAPDAAAVPQFEAGFAAIAALFGPSSTTGEIFTRARDIRSSTGGSISIAAPGGGVTLASDIFGNPLTPPGIVTELGGPISIFTNTSVDIGQARIFTLRGGDILIWSSTGNIAAGTAPRTVVTAPPTRVVVDATSASVATDLGGLATGGGIGALASVEGVPPANIDLVAPVGTVDAGDAGIRVTGNLTIAANAVLNASNIQVAGTSTGVPTGGAVAAPNLGALTSATNAAASSSVAASDLAAGQNAPQPASQPPSIITVEVLGYGG